MSGPAVDGSTMEPYQLVLLVLQWRFVAIARKIRQNDWGPDGKRSYNNTKRGGQITRLRYVEECNNRYIYLIYDTSILYYLYYRI